MIELLSKPMAELRRAAEPIVTAGRLDTRLRDLLDHGLTVDDGCLFLTRYTRNIATSPYRDPTGLESWVNSFHLDDYFPPSDPPGEPGWAAACVGQGVLLARELLDRAALTPILPGPPRKLGDPATGAAPAPVVHSLTLAHCRRRSMCSST